MFKIRFLMILKISDFCQKFGFWVFLEVTGHSGILEISIFSILGRFQNFVFFDFLGGLKILAGGYGAVLVGVSIPPTQPCKEGARRSIFDDFENFGFLSKIWFLGYLGKLLEARGLWKFEFFWFLVDLKILIFWKFWAV